MDPGILTASLGDLPIELHEQIISYLPWRDRVNCEHVCKVWREVIRKRFSGGRYTIAPWLPEQTFDFEYYAPLRIHNLLLERNTFSFKCHKGHRFSNVPGYMKNDLFEQFGSSMTEDYLGFSEYISSFKVTEKTGEGENITTTTYPIDNLSLLNDMAFFPAFLYDDEIVKLYCAFTRQVPDEGESTESSNTETTSATTDEGDASQASSETTTRPSRVNVSDGSFTTVVHVDSEEKYFRLTLGGLFLRIREKLVEDVLRDENSEANSSSSSSFEQQLAKDIRKMEVENATLTIEDLHFVKIRENQALSIVFNVLFLPDKYEGSSLVGTTT
ncbi:hypothetical protein TWF694_002113 [Orbilia ellipsospora]|uniref:F-box domain-containing protein n=1 Tax=Orbilia ellipsospora TaxID=2528407 RepID=A0AAV9XAS3_9PEZI